MAGSSASLHEDPERLSETVVDRHRALVSIMEELEAVDWYDQRAHATTDGSLREILAHNRDEEKEHAAMTLEWLRRHDTKLDEHLRRYLFTESDVLSIEEAAEHGGGVDDPARDSLVGDSSLGLGSLKAVIV
jgi:ferritin-like protein